MSDNDLTITRVIKAPRTAVWRAWEDPEHFVKWWAPAPVITISNKHEFYAGGAFDTTMQLEDGTLMEGGEGCFLEVIENERIAFTDALSGGWRPNKEPFMTVIVQLSDAAEGTEYRATVLHANAEDRQKHEAMGFLEGWGTALEQLSRIAERL